MTKRRAALGRQRAPPARVRGRAASDTDARAWGSPATRVTTGCPERPHAPARPRSRGDERNFPPRETEIARRGDAGDPAGCNLRQRRGRSARPRELASAAPRRLDALPRDVHHRRHAPGVRSQPRVVALAARTRLLTPLALERLLAVGDRPHPSASPARAQFKREQAYVHDNELTNAIHLPVRRLLLRPRGS